MIVSEKLLVVIEICFSVADNAWYQAWSSREIRLMVTKVVRASTC